MTKKDHDRIKRTLFIFASIFENSQIYDVTNKKSISFKDISKLSIDNFLNRNYEVKYTPGYNDDIIAAQAKQAPDTVKYFRLKGIGKLYKEPKPTPNLFNRYENNVSTMKEHIATMVKQEVANSQRHLETKIANVTDTIFEKIDEVITSLTKYTIDSSIQKENVYKDKINGPEKPTVL